MSTISAIEHPFRTIDVLGSTMAYVELNDNESASQGPTFIFQHGNPTSSYLWRNIMAPLSDLGRCIAIDLIGMGHSDKLANSGPDQYTLQTHIEHFDAALDALDIFAGDGQVVLVIHDWGSAIGFDWANRHRDRVKGLCYMEAIVKPMTWDEWPEASRKIFQGFRSESGESMVLDKNVFVERVLPGSVMRDLTDEEMAVYRRPFAEAGETRRPTLTWPRQIPLDDEPADVVARVQAYADWLSESDIPKLFINADPGAILVGPQREFCRRWPNQTEVTVAGNHFLQEDSPSEIAAAIRDWYMTL